jgi:hypothetical protein
MSLRDERKTAEKFLLMVPKLLQNANDRSQNCRGYEKVILAHVIPAALRLLPVVDETSCIGDWLR